MAFNILNPIAIFDQQVTRVWPRRTDSEGPSPEAHTSDENVLAIVEIDRGGPAIFEIKILNDHPLAILQNQRCVISKEVDAWKRSRLLMCGRQLVGFALITLKIEIGPDFCFRSANGNWLGLRTTFAIDGDRVTEAAFIQMKFATRLKPSDSFNDTARSSPHPNTRPFPFGPAPSRHDVAAKVTIT